MKRKLNLILVGYGIMGLLILIFPDLLKEFFEKSGFPSFDVTIIKAMGIMILSLPVFKLAVEYLRKDNIYNTDFTNTENTIYRIETLQNDLNKLKENKFTSISLEPSEKDSIIEEITTNLKDKVDSNLLKRIEEKYSIKIIEDKIYGEIIYEFETYIKRLQNEIISFYKRANINFALAITITFIGFILLSITVLNYQAQSVEKEGLSIFLHFLPRASLVVLIEIFAYMFIGLYKTNIEDTKYYNKEMNYVQANLIAFKIACMSDKKIKLDEIINNFSILKRKDLFNNQNDSDNNDIKSVLSVISELLKKIK